MTRSLAQYHPVMLGACLVAGRTSVGVQRAFFSASGSGVLTDLGSLVKGNGSSTATGLSGHLVVGSSEVGAGCLPVFHAALWIVP
jgi:hypothetical protein